jgi:bifunctional ADP-heptose synthase (sugar kinase/adenylyltransferase)
MIELIGKRAVPTKQQLLDDPKVQNCDIVGESIHFLRRQKPLIKIGFYAATFDRLRPKDAVFLSVARTKCDMLVVLLPTSYSLRLQKNYDAHPEFNERAFLVASLPFVDWVCAYDEETPDLAADKINPDYIFYGCDARDENNMLTKRDKLVMIEHPFGLIENEPKKIPSKFLNLPTE